MFTIEMENGREAPYKPSILESNQYSKSDVRPELTQSSFDLSSEIHQKYRKRHFILKYLKHITPQKLSNSR